MFVDQRRGLYLESRDVGTVAAGAGLLARVKGRVVYGRYGVPVAVLPASCPNNRP